MGIEHNPSGVIGSADDSSDIWIAQRELCQRLGYSSSTIRRLRQRGLPCLGHDRLRRYHWPTVLQWLAEHA